MAGTRQPGCRAATRRHGSASCAGHERTASRRSGELSLLLVLFSPPICDFFDAKLRLLHASTATCRSWTWGRQRSRCDFAHFCSTFAHFNITFAQLLLTFTSHFPLFTQPPTPGGGALTPSLATICALYGVDLFFGGAEPEADEAQPPLWLASISTAATLLPVILREHCRLLS